jgi:hypothetical protein
MMNVIGVYLAQRHHRPRFAFELVQKKFAVLLDIVAAVFTRETEVQRVLAANLGNATNPRAKGMYCPVGKWIHPQDNQ